MDKIKVAIEEEREYELNIKTLEKGFNSLITSPSSVMYRKHAGGMHAVNIFGNDDMKGDVVIGFPEDMPSGYYLYVTKGGRTVKDLYEINEFNLKEVSYKIYNALEYTNISNKANEQKIRRILSDSYELVKG